MVKLCLTSIVKNESKIIQRMLRTVLPIVDYINICDTGSTDKTVELIHELLKDNEYKVKYKINHNDWKDFGHNRTLSITTAKRNFPDADYLLFIDADMKLEIGKDFDKNKLTEHAYSIVQESTVQKWFNVRIVNAKCNWICVGRTHEHYRCLDCQNKPHTQLHTIKINDISDGGCKENKFTRDIELLKLDLEEIEESKKTGKTLHITEDRTVYYKSQSLQCLQRYEEAIEGFQKRIQLGGWHEEQYVSYLKIGECYQSLGKFDEALSYYLQSYNFRPQRLEGLCKMAEMCRLKTRKDKDDKDVSNPQNLLVYAMMTMGIKTNRGLEDVLFVDKASATWKPHFELSIAAMCIGKTEIGIASALKVLEMKNAHQIPQVFIERTEKNIELCLKQKGIDMKRIAEANQN
jgi:tetratricopeptide (TPR) repeat protein